MQVLCYLSVRDPRHRLNTAVRDIIVEKMENLLLQRPTGHEIEYEYLALLTNAIDASDTLLDGHRIPRHVEIDQRIAELHVAPLAAGFGREQNRHMVAERGNDSEALSALLQALRIEPKNVSALRAASTLYLKNDRHDQALLIQIDRDAEIHVRVQRHRLGFEVD